MHIRKLGLSPAALACARAAGITRTEQLTTHTAADLIDSGHFGGPELYDIVCRLNEHNLCLPATSGGQMRPPSERNREMLRLRLVEGRSLAEIGKQTGVSQERVRQILNQHFGLWGRRT
jgi:hypothetical protein